MPNRRNAEAYSSGNTLEKSIRPVAAPAIAAARPVPKFQHSCINRESAARATGGAGAIGPKVWRLTPPAARAIRDSPSRQGTASALQTVRASPPAADDQRFRVLTLRLQGRDQRVFALDDDVMHLALHLEPNACGDVYAAAAVSRTLRHDSDRSVLFGLRSGAPINSKAAT
jgi:hypothetical protein